MGFHLVRLSAAPTGPRHGNGITENVVGQIYRAHDKKCDAVISVVVGLVIWQMMDSVLIDNPLVLVEPQRTGEAVLSLLARSKFARHAYTTFGEFILGLSVGVVIGIRIGVLTTLSRTAKDILNPWVMIAYNTPIILLAPLFVTALGVGIASKIAIVFIGAVFPVLFNTYAGITTVDRRLVESVRSFGGSRRQIFFKVTVPNAVPLL